MVKEVKASNQEEFNAACSNGNVYGKIRSFFVYVELGEEQEYQERQNDNPKTTYRFFRNCKIEYSETEEQCEQGISQYVAENVNVILFY